MKRLSIIVIIGIFIITGCDWQRTSKEPSNNAQHQQVIKIDICRLHIQLI